MFSYEFCEISENTFLKNTSGQLLLTNSTAVGFIGSIDFSISEIKRWLYYLFMTYIDFYKLVGCRTWLASILKMRLLLVFDSQYSIYNIIEEREF